MSRISFLTLAALILTASPAFAASQTTTEQVASFERVVEAPAMIMSGRGQGGQAETERVAAFDERVEGAAFAASSSPATPSATEHVAVFDAESAPAAAAAAQAPSRVAAQCEKTCACGRG
jgi:hypothetical protein